jgi:chromate transporter
VTDTPGNSPNDKTDTKGLKFGANGQPWPNFAEALVVWVRIALLSFGGPAGQIAVMHRILVEEKRWLGEARFLHALNFCMLLPGPEAQQLAVYVGWLMHRTLGGIIAGLFFIFPGVVAILVLSWIYAAFGEVQFITGLFFGLKAAVLAIVLQAVFRIGKRALLNSTMIAIAAASFVAIFIFGAPFPAIVFAAGLIGYVGSRAGIQTLSVSGGHGSASADQVPDADTILGLEIRQHDHAEASQSRKTGAIFLFLWLVPIAATLLAFGPSHVFSEIAVFFSKMAVVTFGGAYAVLAYVAQAAVETFGWLAPGEMLDGLGMAETTPGPLIMVTQFVGFMGAYRNPGMFSPLQAGTIGSLLTTWVTFTPCFLWILVGAPYIEKLRGNHSLSAALTAITAAVVGVVLNLGVWFALHVIFRNVGTFDNFGLHVAAPQLSTIDLPALGLTVSALLAVFYFKVGTVPLLIAAAVLGVTLTTSGLVQI